MTAGPKKAPKPKVADTSDRKWTVVEMPFPERILAKNAAKRAKQNQAQWLAQAIRRAVADERDDDVQGEILAPGSGSSVTMVDGPAPMSEAERREALLLAEHIAERRNMRIADRVYAEIGHAVMRRLGLPEGSRPFQPLRKSEQNRLTDETDTRSDIKP